MTCRSVWEKERRRPEFVTARPKKETPGREIDFSRIGGSSSGDYRLEAGVGDEDVAVLLEADDHRAATGVVITHLAAAQQRAPRGLAGTALAAGRKADRHGHRLAGLGARRIQDGLVGRLRAAALRTLVLVGMLVAILDAGVGRAARLGTAVGLKAARRVEGTADWARGRSVLSVKTCSCKGVLEQFMLR